MSVAPRVLLSLALLGTMSSPVMAQGMPSSQPGILSIIIEDIKVGMESAHAAELDRLWRADAEYLNSATTIQAVARPDLSYGPFPNRAMVRYYDISIIRVWYGHRRRWGEERLACSFHQ